MARPKSMSDFSQLLDQQTPLGKGHGVERPRKKPSVSLAAGLIMNHSSEGTPRSGPATPRDANSPPRQEGREYSENLFYAYAQKSDFAPSPPYILTFANAAVCTQWWDLVRVEYPSSTRLGPQLFVLKGDHMQDRIQDNPRFHHLRDKWFYTASTDTSATAVLPLQDYYGNPIAGSGPLQPPVRRNSIREGGETPNTPAFDMSALTTALDKMAEMIAANSAAIQALSVAQSSGLASMQAINESNSTQIKNLTDNQSALQSLIGKNASHYIALSNSSFQAQDEVKAALAKTAEQIAMLAPNQERMSRTCEGILRTLDSVTKNVSSLASSVHTLLERDRERVEFDRQRRTSDAGSTMSSSSTTFSPNGNRISPAPRKLNRKIRGVWYEYDSALLTPPKSPATAQVGD